MTYYSKDQKMSWQYRLINDIFSIEEDSNCSISTLDFPNMSEIKKKHCPYSLHKFYAPTIENVSDVQNKLLWLASPDTFNDPYDCYLTFDSDEFKRYYAIRAFNNASIFTQEQKNIIYRTDAHSFYSKYREIVENSNRKSLKSFDNKLWKKTLLVREYIQSRISNKYRIACFSSYFWDTKNYEQLMWAHYAHSHKGFCVEYDISPLFDEIVEDKDLLPHYSILKKEGFLHSFEQRRMMINGFFPVQYSSKQVEVPKTLCYAISKGSCDKKQICDINIKAFRAIITKQLPWQYEQEWRLVVDSCVSERVNHKIPFPFAKKIIVGIKASDELKRILSDTAKMLDIPINVF